MRLLGFLIGKLLSRPAIALIEVIVVVPQILTVLQVWQMLWRGPDLHE